MEWCLKYFLSKFLVNIGFIFWSVILFVLCVDVIVFGVENFFVEMYDYERSCCLWSISGKYIVYKNFEEYFVSG